MLWVLAFGLMAQSRTPDRIILTMETDPATSMAVTWRTDTTVNTGIAQLNIASDAPNMAGTATRIEATSQLLAADGKSMHYHSVNFTGLQPATLYAYRVGDGEVWSEWFHFRTAADKQEEYSFIYFGDAQNDIKSLWSRVIRKAFSEMPDAAFMLHAGDLIDGRKLDEEWGEWHHAGGFIHGMIPSIPTPGNHEYYIPGGNNALTPYWRPGFTLPGNGPDGLEETVYYIDYQGTRIISLNSMAALMNPDHAAAQAKWLEEVLQNNPNKWTVVTFHHPVFSTARNRDNRVVRENFKPLFDKYGVDLVLQGHDHTYARGQNIAEGVSAQSGHTMYVVSVSGPKMYEQSSEPWWDIGTENTQLYQLITVKPDQILYRAYTATGKLFDSFEINRASNGSKSVKAEK